MEEVKTDVVEELEEEEVQIQDQEVVQTEAPKSLDEKLKADTPAEKDIKKYLLENASEPLKEKMMGSDKNIKDCLAYISSEFKSRAVNGCGVGTDEEVYGMAIHYFEEDEIKKGSVSIAAVTHSKSSEPAVDLNKIKADALKEAKKQIEAERGKIDVEKIRKQAIADYKAEEKAKKEEQARLKEEAKAKAEAEKQKAIEEAKRKEQEESETLGGMFDLL